MNRRLLLYPLALALLLPEICCNSTDNERFSGQLEYFIFGSTTSVLEAHGASKVSNTSTNAFRCPSISGMSSESDLTVFYASANAPTPSFSLTTVAGIRGDTSGGIGISLSNLPLGMLDIFERCNSTSYEKLMTACPSGYTLVDECSDVALGAKECRQVYSGTHQIVMYSTVVNSPDCISEETDRTPYGASITEMAYACDAFTPIPVPAAIRGSMPIHSCCDTAETNTFDFCLKPCGCRETTVELIPKAELIDNPDPDEINTIRDQVSIAVFSNVEGNKSAFRALLNSINENDIDVAISLGNLTGDGKAASFESFKQISVDAFNIIDGTINQSIPEIGINTTCKSENAQICCDDTIPGVGRIFSNLCNALVFKTAFLNGLGESEYEGSLSTYYENFGPSNLTTMLGKAQIIMLDTAEATINSAQKSWLEGELQRPAGGQCNIPKPTEFEEWPLLSECHEILNIPYTETVTCRECIGQEAFCIPPEAGRDEVYWGPENCICVPHTSTVCPGNLSCEAMDGLPHNCICTRDQDCGEGGTCIDGVCKDPLRLFFSYTPLFDVSGTRNNGFASKKTAASLLSMLLKYNVKAIFAGRVLDYAAYSRGGMPMYITGGGGADMASFASKGRHWLRIDIAHAYTNPTPEDIQVTVVEY